MSETLIERLVADLPPVRPRRASGDLGILLLVVAAAAALIFAAGLARPDLGQPMPPMFWWKLAVPSVIAVVASIVALRALDPAQRSVGTAWLGGLALAALLLGVVLTGDGNPVGTLDPVSGVRCVLFATVFALPPALALGVLLHRGAPAHPRRVAFAAAIAGGAWGAALLGLHCPNDDAVHSLVWHSLGVVVPALAAALPLARAARW